MQKLHDIIWRKPINCGEKHIIMRLFKTLFQKKSKPASEYLGYFEKEEAKEKLRMEELVREGVASLRTGKDVMIYGKDSLDIAINIKKQFLWEEQLKISETIDIEVGAQTKISYHPSRRIT